MSDFVHLIYNGASALASLLPLTQVFSSLQVQACNSCVDAATVDMAQNALLMYTS
jgi:hypothetical protein